MLLYILLACINVSDLKDAVNDENSIDRDGDGFSINDGDCDDNDINITVAECTDDDNDGQSEYEGDCDDTNPFVYTGIAYNDDINKEFCMKDADGDGFGDNNPPDGLINGTDCNDDNADTYPDAEDTWYDGVDSNCDGANDYDQDGDGHAAIEHDGDDCNDEDNSVNPSVEEIWYDGFDSNCDGANDYDQDGDGHTAIEHDGDDCNDVDNSINPSMEDTWYDGVDSNCDEVNDYDQDGDGHTAIEHNGDDCNDEDNSVNPSVEEIWYDGADSNCDGVNDYDQDGDGHTAIEHDGDDCNDEDNSVNPSMEDIWYDGVDSNCDGANDYDQDGDGHAAIEHDGDDCNDGDNSVNPSVEEIWYDGFDSNCDGANDYDQDGDGHVAVEYAGDDCNDEDSSILIGSTYFVDADGDGFGDPDNPVVLCEIQTGYSVDNTDCNDGSNQVNPDKIDTILNQTDNNCDGLPGVDEDGDGYASLASGGNDCDDTDLDINPYAGDNWYDGIDHDCQGNDDYDRDGDGYVLDEWANFSDLPSGDCDDENADVTFNIGYEDLDGDGHGGTQTTYCSTSSTEYFETNTDCDDDDNTVYNEAMELCDGQWNNCLTQVDGTGAPENEIDNDGDGYVECDPEEQVWQGESPINGGNDCDDTVNTIYEGADELCDNRDNDCDGSLSYAESDYDNDGFIICDPNDPNITNSAWGSNIPNSGDCAPDDSQRFPGQEELCDGIDNDCDNVVDNNPTDGEFVAYFDNDGDGYGNNTTSNPPITHCGDIPENYAEESGDCNDDDSTITPEVICDGQENECDPITEIELPNANLTGQITVSEDTRFCVQNTATIEFSASIVSNVKVEMYPHSNNTSSTFPTTITCASDGTNNDYPVFLVDNKEADITIDGITFSNCTGASVIDYYGSGTIEIDNANFEDNLNNDNGGALYIDTNSNTSYPEVYVNNTIFKSNIADLGGAIFAKRTYLYITDSTFSLNETHGISGSTKYGGAIGIHGLPVNQPNSSTFSILDIENTNFVSNSSDEGGAIAALRTNVNIDDSFFTGNSSKTSDASYKGGALIIEESDVEVEYSVFHQNNGGSGSAIYTSKSSVDLFHNTFSENTDTIRGVVLIHRGETHNAKNNRFIDNETDYDAPFIFERDKFNSQPLTSTSAMFMTMENNYFSRNQGVVGAILLNDVGFQLRNNIIAYNSSIAGSSNTEHVGGVSIINPNTNPLSNENSIIDGLTIDNNLVSPNIYQGIGGLYIKHKPLKTSNTVGLEVSNSLVTNNKLEISGSGPNTSSADMVCSLCRNPTNGAVYVEWVSTNSSGNQITDLSSGSTTLDNKSGLPGFPSDFPISNHSVYYVDNSSNQSQDYRLCTDSSVCPTVTSSILSQNGTTDFGADPFSQLEYRSYGAFGGPLAEEWDLDNDDYDFCYSIDDALDCTCLDSNDFDSTVNVDDEDVCEE